jgi:purine-binding chemotaxis protein CheW
MAATAAFDRGLETPAPIEVKAPDQFVTFTCSDRAFGIDIMSVREIRSWTPVTELPGQPHGAKGVLDIRGNIVQVYDLGTLLGSGVVTTSDTQPQVVLVVSLEKLDVGLVVDSVSDIIFADGEDLRRVPASERGGSGQVSALVRNEDRLIAILDLGALFPSADNIWFVD